MRRVALSALALIALAWSTTTASACGGWAGCDYGYAGYGGYGYAGYGYTYSYYAAPVVAYYAPPVYYAPRAYYAPPIYAYGSYAPTFLQPCLLRLRATTVCLQVLRVSVRLGWGAPIWLGWRASW